jgi:deoxycytidine triphosphate deaminase
VVFLEDLFTAHSPELMGVAESWAADTYDYEARGELVDSIANLFDLGIPGGEVVDVPEGAMEVVDADIINATWVARLEGQKTPTSPLALKALDDLEFLRSWSEAGGDRLDVHRASKPIDIGGLAVLTAAAIESRLGPPGEGSLVVTPLVPGFAKDAALDVRLGNQFIVFERRRITHLDPLDADSDPRSIQAQVELRWDENFVLHPNELVLASTLEYFVLPDDLSAQVITRSSYGRLGLLTATAVLIHPRFRGCLTLELVNLSNLPLELKPGERIAQVLLLPALPPPPEQEPKYDCPTGPQFSKVRSDPEAAVLRELGK